MIQHSLALSCLEIGLIFSLVYIMSCFVKSCLVQSTSIKFFHDSFFRISFVVIRLIQALDNELKKIKTCRLMVLVLNGLVLVKVFFFNQDTLMTWGKIIG